ncbi:hypothetical protein LTR62_004544 [Meristemomyces frigidus]|uniref:Uncharacterized protein n=1 Tax=Meristemomyces frigidus TaxID=1508187 RepID=A0AAN7YRB8_9PEZI|nr:hypothetical protein LTR62_004544 [Meristemomyces frigidus]
MAATSSELKHPPTGPAVWRPRRWQPHRPRGENAQGVCAAESPPYTHFPTWGPQKQRTSGQNNPQPWSNTLKWRRDPNTPVARPVPQKGHRSLPLPHRKKWECIKLFPHAPVPYYGLDVQQHWKEWQAYTRRLIKASADRHSAEEAERHRLEQKYNITFTPPPPLRQPLDGKTFSPSIATPTAQSATNHSLVLARRTIWCPTWQASKPDIALWPSAHELHDQGDDRMSSSNPKNPAAKRDPCVRFLPLPRARAVGGENWQQVRAIDQSDFDDCYRTGFYDPSSVGKGEWESKRTIDWQRVWHRAYPLPMEVEFGFEVDEEVMWVPGDGWVRGGWRWSEDVVRAVGSELLALLDCMEE